MSKESFSRREFLQFCVPGFQEALSAKQAGSLNPLDWDTYGLLGLTRDAFILALLFNPDVPTPKERVASAETYSGPIREAMGLPLFNPAILHQSAEGLRSYEQPGFNKLADLIDYAAKNHSRLPKIPPYEDDVPIVWDKSDAEDRQGGRYIQGLNRPTGNTRVNFLKQDQSPFSIEDMPLADAGLSAVIIISLTKQMLRQTPEIAGRTIGKELLHPYIQADIHRRLIEDWAPHLNLTPVIVENGRYTPADLSNPQTVAALGASLKSHIIDQPDHSPLKTHLQTAIDLSPVLLMMPSFIDAPNSGLIDLTNIAINSFALVAHLLTTKYPQLLSKLRRESQAWVNSDSFEAPALGLSLKDPDTLNLLADLSTVLAHQASSNSSIITYT